jgi:hypothetical protein
MQLSTVIGSLNLTLDRLYRLEPNYSSLLAVINSPVLLNPLCLLVELSSFLQNDAYFDFGRVKPLRHYSAPTWIMRSY